MDGAASKQSLQALPPFFSPRPRFSPHITSQPVCISFGANISSLLRLYTLFSTKLSTQWSGVVSISAWKQIVQVKLLKISLVWCSAFIWSPRTPPSPWGSTTEAHSGKALFLALKALVPRRVLHISSDHDDQMEAKIKTKNKSLRFPTKPKKLPGPKVNPPKNPMPNLHHDYICRLLFDQATQGRYLPNFPTQKNPGIENFTPQKKFFNHPCHLKSRVRKSVVVLLR